ncbi:hypothetical protein HYDPIDRAFT_109862 [Hydnomerulius pinastri MD-312]|nr:hypothetical protein HYDPIDRAFT_109862 [Hydnomerulius pinastri MD-312]
MSAWRTRFNVLAYLVVVALFLNLTLKIVFLAHISTTSAPTQRSLSNLPWNVEKKQVLLPFDTGLRYGLHDSEQWSALVPRDGLVYLGEDHQPAMVSMMHQLRCIDILREQLSLPKTLREEQPARHCMNYLRQMTLCRGDIYLDPFQYASRIKAVDPIPIRKCLDWEAVYDAIEVNQRDHDIWVAEHVESYQ